MNQTRSIRLPVHVIKELNKYLRIARELARKLNHTPSVEEIAAVAKKPASQIKEMMDLMLDATSIDVPIGDDSSKTLLDSIADENAKDPAAQVQDVDLLANIEGLD